MRRHIDDADAVGQVVHHPHLAGAAGSHGDRLEADWDRRDVARYAGIGHVEDLESGVGGIHGEEPRPIRRERERAHVLALERDEGRSLPAWRTHPERGPANREARRPVRDDPAAGAATERGTIDVTAGKRQHDAAGRAEIRWCHVDRSDRSAVEPDVEPQPAAAAGEAKMADGSNAPGPIGPGEDAVAGSVGAPANAPACAEGGSASRRKDEGLLARRAPIHRDDERRAACQRIACERGGGRIVERLHADRPQTHLGLRGVPHREPPAADRMIRGGGDSRQDDGRDDRTEQRPHGAYESCETQASPSASADSRGRESSRAPVAPSNTWSVSVAAAMSGWSGK